VVESDFRIQPIVTQTPAGNTRFAVRNTGPSAHEFLVFRTNFPETALPTAADGRVVETAPGLTKVIDSGSALARGKSRSFTARLRPGAYVLVCNIGAHYGLGMHATLLVS
jgi:uncharacterized cupredoxin-like copper-binding protein